MNTPQPILYLTYDGLTDPLGQSQVLPYLIGLSRKGYRFQVVSFEKQEAYQRQRNIIEEQTDENRITWHPQIYHKSPPIASAIYDLRNMQRLASKLHRNHGFSAVWCRSYLPAMVGMGLKRKYAIKFIFDMRGFWADERVEGGTWPQTNSVYRMVYYYFKRKEKQLLAAADHVVVLTHKAKAILEAQQLHGNPVPEAITVIPCCVDTDHFDPARITDEAQEDVQRNFGLTLENKVLVYAGSVGTWYMVEEMLEYFMSLYQQNPMWRFLIITKESEKTILDQVIDQKLDTDLIIVTPAKRDEMPLFLSLGTRAISYIRPSFSKQASSPTKLGEYLSMGLPCECNSGVGDVDEIMSDLNQIMKDPIQLRSYAQQQFGLKSGIDRYLKVFMG